MNSWISVLLGVIILYYITDCFCDVVVREFNKYEGSVCYLRGAEDRVRGVCRKSCHGEYWIEYKDDVCNPRESPPLYCCVDETYPTLNKVCLNRITAREFELIYETEERRARQEVDEFKRRSWERYYNIIRGCKQMWIDQDEEYKNTSEHNCFSLVKNLFADVEFNFWVFYLNGYDQDRSVAQIGLRYLDNNITWICSGHFIDLSYVLTAASCVSTKKNNLNVVKDCNGDLYKIHEVIVHDQYDHDRLNDIAILNVDRIDKNKSLPVYKDVIPTCLWTESEIPNYNLTAYNNETLICNTTQLEPSVCEKKFNMQPLHYTNACFSCASKQLFDDGVTFLRHTGGLLSAVPYIFAIGSNKITSEGDEPMVVTKIYPYSPWIESVISRDRNRES